jgi:hypothetical protein
MLVETRVEIQPRVSFPLGRKGAIHQYATRLELLDFNFDQRFHFFFASSAKNQLLSLSPDSTGSLAMLY